MSSVGGTAMIEGLCCDLNLNEQQVKAIIDRLVDHFGITEFSKDGGYILTDGRLLDLQRSVDEKKQYHRVIAELLPPEMKGISDEMSIVNLLVSTGVIRYEPTGRVHVAAFPTAEQRRKLFEIMKYSVNNYRIIVSDVNGATLGDQTFRSPAAHELRNFFSASFSSDNRQYLDDEFTLRREGDDWLMIFRSDKRVIGRYFSADGSFQLSDDFVAAKPLFEKLIQRETEC
jgi:hypothetical protein